MIRRLFAFILACLTLLSVVSPAYAAEDGTPETVSCTNSPECPVQEHNADCCKVLGCAADAHLSGCRYYIAVESCESCSGTVEVHGAECVTFCTRLEDCGAGNHYGDCQKISSAFTHAEGCKYPEADHDVCKTQCDSGCILDPAHTGDCHLFTACTYEGCNLADGHTGLHSNQEACSAEGCAFASGHSGLHSNQEKCPTEGCELATDHAGLHSNETKCAAEGCEFATDHAGLHSNETKCAAEGCEFAADHTGLHSNQEKCPTEGCRQALGHEGSCIEPEIETPTLSAEVQNVIAMLEALPAPDSISPDISDEEWAHHMDALQAAMDAYNALGAEDMNLVNEEYTQLVLDALALNDALTGNPSTTYAEIKYDRYSRSNVTITVNDIFDYPVTGAVITVTRGNNTHEVVELGNGQYAFTKSQGEGQYNITVAATEKYVAVEENIGRNPNAATLTVDIQPDYEYLQLFRLYYYIKEEIFPRTYAGAGDPQNYGPSGDDTPFVEIYVDVNKLRTQYATGASDAVVRFDANPSNGNQWQFTPMGNTTDSEALENTKKFWTAVLACVPGDDFTRLNATAVGPIFYGYAAKKQSGGTLHIDGILDPEKIPIYIVEMYDNGVFFDEFYTAKSEGNFKTMAEVLAEFEDRLGADVTVNWNAQPTPDGVYTGTYVKDNMLYTVSVAPMPNANKGIGSDTQKDIQYYQQSADGAYFLAKFNMTRDAGVPLYTVTYQWKVLGTDGYLTDLPAGTHSIPGSVTGLQYGDNYEYDKGFQEGTTYYDYENGILYIFSGWTNYAHVAEFSQGPNEPTYKEVSGDTIPITGDTWINGIWTTRPLTTSGVYLNVRKRVSFNRGGDIEYVTNYLARDEEGKMFISIGTNKEGTEVVDVDYGDVVDGYKLAVYGYGEDHPFTFTEKQADVPGYDRVTTIKLEDVPTETVTNAEGIEETVALSVLQEADENNTVTGDSATVHVRASATGITELGTVTIINTYSRKKGTPVDVLPVLQLYKYAGDTNEALGGVEFTLTEQNNAAKVETVITSHDETAKGQLTFDGLDADGKNVFNGTTSAGIPEGTYILKEVKAPNGYKICEHAKDGYTVKVTGNEPTVELRYNETDQAYEYVEVTYHTVTIAQEEECSHCSLIAPRTGSNTTDTYLLRLSNPPVLGRVTFTKAFETANGPLPETAVSDVFMQLQVHGPITRDGTNITSIGELRGTVELRASQGWEATLNNLPIGEYLVSEPIYDVHNYSWTGADYAVNDKSVAVTYNGKTYALIKVEEKLQTSDTNGTGETNSTGETGETSDTGDTVPVTLKVTNKYTEWEAGHLAIYKVTEGNNPSPLGGAQFTLYSDAGCNQAIETITTNEYGVARFDNLTIPKDHVGEILTYYLKETKAPNGYYLSTEVWKVEIKLVEEGTARSYETKVSHMVNGEWQEAMNFSRTDDLLTITNSPVKGRLNIKKTFITTQPQGIGSITVEIRNQNDTLVETVALNQSGNWTATVADLPLGTYTVKEVSYNVPGYDLVKATRIVNGEETGDPTVGISVTLEDTTGLILRADTGPVVDVALRNEYRRNEEFIDKTASFTVRKVDSADNTKRLKNAEFTLYAGEGTTGSVVQTLYTNDQGEVEFSGLKGSEGADGEPVPGIYTLKETKAPDGYINSETTWKVTVEENDGEYRVKLNEQGTAWENIWDWIISGITGGSTDDWNAATKVLTVGNSKVKYDLTLTKTFKEQGEEQDKTLTPPTGASVQMKVTGPNGYDEIVILDGTVDDTENTAWTATLPDLSLGQYTVTETMASLHGYTWLSADMKVNGDTKVTATTERAVQYMFTVTDQGTTAGDIIAVRNNGTDSTVAVSVENTYKAWEAVDFYVQKVDKNDHEILLDGVTFTLYEDQNYETVKESVTTESGVAHFENLTVPSGSTEKVYYLKETATRDGYIRCSDIWTVTVTLANNQYDIEIGNTTNGTFDDKTDYLRVENTHIPGILTIQKKIDGVADAHKAEAEIQLEVTGPNNYYEKITLDGAVDTENGVETAPWTATLSDLRMGNYTVKEIKGDIPGYKLNSTTYQEGSPQTSTASEDVEPASNSIMVTLTTENDQKNKTVTITNTYTQNTHEIINPASFEILKVDKNNPDKKLEGAVFGLFDGDEEKFRATTDENGIAKFEGLTGNKTNPPGSVTYTLKEISAPTGYLKTNQTWTVTVKEVDGVVRIELHSADNHYDSVWDWIAGIFKPTDNGEGMLESGRLTVTNEPTRLTLTKTENWYMDGQLSDMDSVEALVGDLGARTYSFQISWETANGTHNVNETITLDETNSGSVTVEGVIPQGAKYEVTELTHGSTAYAVSYGAGCEGTMDKTASATVTNSYYYNQVDPQNVEEELTDEDTRILRTDLYLLKEDTENDNAPLEGAVFKLTGPDGETVTATSDANGHLSLPIYEAGTYTLTETKAPVGYSSLGCDITVEVGKADATETTVEIVNGVYVTVTHVKLEIKRVTMNNTALSLNGNRYVVDNDPLVNITVKKDWQDDNYYARPDSVKVTLFENGKKYRNLTLTAQNKWTCTVEDLDASSNWTLEEEVPDGYTSEITRAGNTFTVTNTRQTGVKDISVKKVWKYKDHVARPTSVDVTLTGTDLTGNIITKVVTLNAANNWQHVWEDMPDNYHWEVDEKSVPKDYSKSVKQDGEDWIITNRAKSKLAIVLSDNPKTGDYILIAVGVMIITAAALVALFIAQKKKK